jgi:hypothetical protein
LRCIAKAQSCSSQSRRRRGLRPAWHPQTPAIPSEKALRQSKRRLRSALVVTKRLMAAGACRDRPPAAKRPDYRHFGAILMSRGAVGHHGRQAGVRSSACGAIPMATSCTRRCPASRSWKCRRSPRPDP